MPRRIAVLVHVFLTTIVPAAAQAQILSAARCQNAYNITPGQAAGRYAWGLYCRNNPATNPASALPFPPDHYLTQASVNDYNARPDLQPYLFPTYFDFTSFVPWDIPFTAGTNCTVMPTSATNVGLCVAGCYTPDQQIRFAGGDVSILDAFEASQADVVTLTPDAAFDDLRFMTNSVSRYVVDREAAQQDVFVFTMESGGVLKVTSTHPLVTSDGQMRQAQDLVVGDELVLASGAGDAIMDVKVEQYFGKVYNLAPTTMDHGSNIVVAQGYLSGSHRYQNEFLDVINSVILRRALADLEQ